jgi:DNA-binding NtrC family response regulator
VPPIPPILREALLSYHWPGNVRELENVMRRFLVYQDPELLAGELTEASLPAKPGAGVANLADFAPRRSLGAGSANGDAKIDYLAEASRQAESKLLLETLEAVRWNRRQAAGRLNIDYKAFLYKLQKHGIVESKAKRGDVGA